MYKTMDVYIKAFSSLVEDGLKIGSAAAMQDIKHPIHNVLIAGLGGSGIGAEIVINYLVDKIEVPIQISKDYTIPKFVNKNTLVIVCSYSGNTEETLHAAEMAKTNNAQIVCITSGGRLKEFAKENGLDTIDLVSGYPPRAYLPSSFAPILFVLKHYQLLSDAFVGQLKSAALFLPKEEESIKELAKNISNQIIGKLPVIYSDQTISSIGTRWRQQFNENSKILGWERAFPEMNHNELVGWKDSSQHLAVVFLHCGCESDRIKKRFDVCKGIISNCTDTLIDVYAKGDNFFEKTFYLILLGDWISLYLAEDRGVDAIEVNAIDFLKSSLCK